MIGCEKFSTLIIGTPISVTSLSISTLVIILKLTYKL